MAKALSTVYVNGKCYLEGDDVSAEDAKLITTEGLVEGAKKAPAKAEDDK